MLGPLGTGIGQWQWGASGKHPVARDYFNIGIQGPMLKAFSDWIDQGYQLLLNKKIESVEPCSWRFWVKGGSKDSMACGLLKGSSDSVGRSFPLLVMGAGVLKGWTQSWHLLPQACEQTWSHMEFISARRYADFKDLEDEVGTIRPPSAEWSAFPTLQIERQCETGLPDLLRAGEENERYLLPLDRIGSCDPKEAVSVLHRFLKDHLDLPNAVFIGGSMRSSYMAVFRRPLGAGDFVRLWTPASETSLW